MKCEKCNIDMQERNGQHGVFYFCPNQTNCGQKTITKISLESVDKFFRTQSVQRHQVRQNQMSKSEKDAEFYWEGDSIMVNIEFGELGGTY